MVCFVVVVVSLHRVIVPLILSIPDKLTLELEDFAQLCLVIYATLGVGRDYGADVLLAIVSILTSLDSDFAWGENQS